MSLDGASYRSFGLSFVAQHEVHTHYARPLGASNAYLQPVLQARSHSAPEPKRRHGYDQVDHQRVSEPFGGQAALDELVDSIHAAGGDVIVDMVPNHTDGEHRLRREQPDVYDTWVDSTGQEHTANFFGLYTLPKLRAHESSVFETTQGFLLNWMARKNRPADNGRMLVRVDHFDGLWNPQAAIGELGSRGFQVIAEHTPTPGENFVTNGTLLGESGYHTMHLLNGVIHKPAGVEAIIQDWLGWANEDAVFRHAVPGKTPREVLRQAKLQVPSISFAADLERLRLDLCRAGHSEVTIDDIVVWTSEMEVIRTYCWQGQTPAENDLRALRSMQAPEWFVQYIAEGNSPFWQSIMAGIHAKAYEDRFLYRWTPVLSLNEVGSILSAGEFHEHVGVWSAAHPYSWTALDTHDTKRSSAVRASLATLTQMPEIHAQTLQKLRAISNKYNQQGSIGPHALRFIFDTMLGAWPCQAERLVEYFEKAFRESAVYTAWPQEERNLEWEANLKRFVYALVDDGEFNRVLYYLAYKMDTEGRELQRSQHLLGLMIPGAFALYHGAEGPNNKWLVDPDNRRPTDYKLLAGMLKNVQQNILCSESMLMALIYRTLHAQQHARQFAGSTWEPLAAPNNCVAVRRGDLIAIVSLDPTATKDDRWLPCSTAQDLLPEFSRQALYIVSPRLN